MTTWTGLIVSIYLQPFTMYTTGKYLEAMPKDDKLYMLT